MREGKQLALRVMKLANSLTSKRKQDRKRLVPAHEVYPVEAKGRNATVLSRRVPMRRWRARHKAASYGFQIRSTTPLRPRRGGEAGRGDANSRSRQL